MRELYGGGRQKDFEFMLGSDYHHDENGDIVDAKGNIYDMEGNLLSTPASPELKVEMDRLNRLHPEWGGNENRLRANAKINLSRKPGTSFASTPYPPLDN